MPGKVFLMHKKEWNYITVPFLVHPWMRRVKGKRHTAVRIKIDNHYL